MAGRMLDVWMDEWMDGWMDGWSVRNPFFLNAENEPFSLCKSSGQSNIDIAECAWCAGCAKCAKCASCASYMCFIHVLHMPMDASLACWALFCWCCFVGVVVVVV